MSPTHDPYAEETSARTSSPGFVSAPINPPARVHQESDEVNLLELATVLATRWRLVAGIPLIVTAVAAIVLLLVPARFTATATFAAETETPSVNLPGGLAGLASQLGVGLTGGSTSPRFYAALLRSRTIQDQVLTSHLPDPRILQTAAPDSATLLDIFGVGGGTHVARLERGREELNKALSVTTNDETFIVTVSVETHYPALSADVSNRFVEMLEQFNLQARQSRGEQRKSWQCRDTVVFHPRRRR